MGGGHFKFPCAYPQIWRVKVDSGSFVSASLWTDNSWYNFQVSQFTGQLLAFLDIRHSSGPWQSPCITRQLQTSKQDNHGVQRKFAFNCQFVRGSVGTPEGISSISGNHWIQCRTPFILDLGSWRHSKHFKKPLDSLSSACYSGSWILEGFRLWTFVLFKSSVRIVWMLDIGHDCFSSGWILEGKYTSH